MATILTVKAVVDGYDKRANCTVFSTQSGVGVLSPLADEGNENQPEWVNKANAKLTKPVITAGEGPEERSNTFVAKAIDGYAGFVGKTTEGFAAMADLGLDFVKLEHKNVDAAFGMRWDTGIKLDKKVLLVALIVLLVALIVLLVALIVLLVALIVLVVLLIV